MATTSAMRDPQTSAAVSEIDLLISLPSMSRLAQEQFLGQVPGAFDGVSLLLATPDADSLESNVSGHRLITYKPATPSPSSWTLVAEDFLNAHELAIQHNARAVLILGAEAQGLTPLALRQLAEPVLTGQSDLAMARYDLPPRSGLVTSAILYPCSRALFGTAVRFPLAIDLCSSRRMSDRLATVAQKYTAANQPDALLWPASEASVANFAIAEVPVGIRTLPQPPTSDLNTLLSRVTSSLFADIDAKAAFWQRSRVAPSTRTPVAPAASNISIDEIGPMLDTFRLAYGNLAEIWSLILPPQSLLGLRRLSVTPNESFSLSDGLWARIVYDFLLAYRLRTINRGHLLGALTPLYLAFAASYLLRTSQGASPEDCEEALAAAFEAEKPYLVSRWRWPDRFNP